MVAGRKLAYRRWNAIARRRTSGVYEQHRKLVIGMQAALLDIHLVGRVGNVCVEQQLSVMHDALHKVDFVSYKQERRRRQTVSARANEYAD